MDEITPKNDKEPSSLPKSPTLRKGTTILKKNIYQMQRAVDFSKIKPQNAWKIYKKITIITKFILQKTPPFTRLDIIKELAPRVYDEMKENLKDLSMNKEKTPIPFFHIFKTNDLKEIEVRYLHTDDEDNTGFELESKDYIATIWAFDEKEDILRIFLKKPIDDSNIIVLLTDRPLDSQIFIQENASFENLLFIFDISKIKASFEGLRNFVESRIIFLHESRIQAIENKIKLASSFENTKPFKMNIEHMNELALKYALMKLSSDKTKFLKNLYLKFGQPPEHLFLNFKKKLETMTLKIIKEIPLCRPLSFKHKNSKSGLMFAISSHKLTENEIKYFSFWVLEQLFFGNKKWKRQLFMYLGRPNDENQWKLILNEIEEKMSEIKHNFHKSYQDLLYSSAKTISIKPRFHLAYFSKGYPLKKTQAFCELLGSYCLKQKFWAEVSKESMKIMLGNQEAGLKIPTQTSELKQFTLTLQGNLQRINDERTSLAYIQQDFSPYENKSRICSADQESSLDVLRKNARNPFCKILVIYSKDCSFSEMIVKKTQEFYKIKGEKKIFSLMKLGLSLETFPEMLKQIVFNNTPSRILLILTKESLEIIERVCAELFPEQKARFNSVLITFHDFFQGENEKILSKFPDDLKKIDFPSVNGVESLAEILKVLWKREQPISVILKEKVASFFKEKSDNSSDMFDRKSKDFFTFLEEKQEENHLNNEIKQELFETYFQLKENAIVKKKKLTVEEVAFSLEKGLKKLELAIETREKKANELQVLYQELLEKKKGFEEKKSNIPDHLAFKIDQFEGNEINFENRYKKAFFTIVYGKNKVGLKHIKGAIIKERFLLSLENLNFIEISIKGENNNLLDLFKVSLQQKDDGNLQKTVSSLTPQISLSTKAKFINFDEETLKINIKNLKEIISANGVFLENLYQFKFNFHSILTEKIKENEEISVGELENNIKNEIENCKLEIAKNEETIKKLKEIQENVKSEKKEENPLNKEEQDKKTIEVDNSLVLRKKEERITQKIDDLILKLENQKKNLEKMMKNGPQKIQIKQKISDFFTAAQESDLSPSDLLKLRDYFLYLQKSVLKFYIKASLIEADLFEMKKDSKKAMIKSGLSMIAGSVPFIGDILKTVVEKGIELKEKYDEMKLARNCTKFCVLIHSSEILSEVLEEVALALVSNKEKQKLILSIDTFKESFWEKLKQKVLQFFKRAKEKILGKKKEEKLLKDIDTPAKLFANIDASYLCAQAVSRVELEGGTSQKEFDSEDPYNKKPLVELFKNLICEVDEKMYQKVLSFNEDRHTVEILNEKKTFSELENEINGFSLKEKGNCVEEIKRNNLDDEIKENNEKVMKNYEVLTSINRDNEITLEQIKEKEKDIEGNIEKLMEAKKTHQILLEAHQRKIVELEHNFNKIELGAKAGILLVKDLKHDATHIEFDLNERTKALTRKSEAIPETVVFLDKYKEVLIKRKAMK